MPSNSDYLNLSNAVYTVGGDTPIAPSGWTLIDSQTTATGMQAAAFQNNTTNEIVIAYEGTNPVNAFTPADFANNLLPQASADISIAGGVNPLSNADALAFALSVKAIAGSNPIYLTGHSLGGRKPNMSSRKRQ